MTLIPRSNGLVRLGLKTALVTSALALSTAPALADGDGPAPGTQLNAAVQSQIASISPAPNTYIVGNDYPGWNEAVSSGSIFSYGPGNPGGYYDIAYIYGDFNHCGYIQDDSSTPTGQGASPLCSDMPKGVGGAFESWFKRTYTNGVIAVTNTGDGIATTLKLNSPNCTSQTGFGNVKPWAKNEKGTQPVPLNAPGGVLNVKWRYVTKSGQFVMVHGPSSPNQPNWFFEPAGCVAGLGA